MQHGADGARCIGLRRGLLWAAAGAAAAALLTPPPPTPPLATAAAPGGPRFQLSIAVAAHSHPAAWLDEFRERADIWVYSKGPSCEPYTRRGLRCVGLSNYGREGATYLHHIVSRWESLAPVTVFTQDDPFEHSPDMLPLLRTLLSNSSFAGLAEWGGALPLTDRFRDVAVPGPIPPREKRELLRAARPGHCRVYVEVRDAEMVPVPPYAFPYARGDLQKVLKRWRAQRKTPPGESTLSFIWRHFAFGGTAPTRYVMAYSAVFAATRQALRRRPLSFWQRWLDAVKEEWPRWPHLTTSVVLEQMWLAALGYSPPPAVAAAMQGEAPADGGCDATPPPRAAAGSCYAPPRPPPPAWDSAARDPRWRGLSCSRLAGAEGPRLPRGL